MLNAECRIIRTRNDDPYLNLAAEEYAVRNFSGSCILIWQNRDTVVVGKSQNTAEEINDEFVKSRGISVVRRITGGGAVFHDRGNVNFSFILPNDGNDAFEPFAIPVVDYLKSLGANAAFMGRNDISIDGKKVSGTAKTILCGNILYHGTLLFDSDLSVLSAALKPNESKFESKTVKSVRARVGNIKEFVKDIDAEKFIRGLYLFLKERFGAAEYAFSEREEKEISALADKKYRTWEWNYGYSPPYTFEAEKRFSFGSVRVRLNVKDGAIEDARISGDFFGEEGIETIESALRGCKHELCAIKSRLNALNVNRCINGADAETLSSLMI